MNSLKRMSSGFRVSPGANDILVWAPTGSAELVGLTGVRSPIYVCNNSVHLVDIMLIGGSSCSSSAASLPDRADAWRYRRSLLPRSWVPQLRHRQMALAYLTAWSVLAFSAITAADEIWEVLAQ